MKRSIKALFRWVVYHVSRHDERDYRNAVAGWQSYVNHEYFGCIAFRDDSGKLHFKW